MTEPTSDVLRRARTVLDEAQASGLSLERLPGNPAKIRLQLDVAARVAAAGRPLRVLDVGAGGRNNPFNLWEPFLPLAGLIELIGVDVAFLEPTRRRAAEIGFPVELVEGSAEALVRAFGPGSFDVVVSTQVLEHLPRWRDALREFRDVTRPGGAMLATWDSGDLELDPVTAVRLAGKRAYARLGDRLPAARRVLSRVVSGEWEEGPTKADTASTVAALGLRTLALRHYCLRDLKTVQHLSGSEGRLLWLALEEALEPGHEHLFKGLYLAAERPA